MTENKPQCLVCTRTSDEIPLLSITYRDAQYWICPQHFPVLIHHPEQLVGKLPGAERLAAHEE